MSSLWLFWVFKVVFLVTSAHIPECPTVLDVIFMIDTSMNINNSELTDTKEFIKNIIPYINPSIEGITRRHQISGTQDVSTIQRAVDEIQRGIGQPVMYRAFSVATGDVGEHRPQKDLKRLLVVASNGRYIHPDLAVSSAQQPKDDGIVIISLWINTNVTKEQLESVATSKRLVVIAHSSRDYTAMSNLVSLICEAERESGALISYSAERSALKGHVIETVHAWDDFSCAFSCLRVHNCFSFNFKKISQACELIHTNRLTSLGDIIKDFDSSYHELTFL
ncbi:hypothetical protein pdam_00007555 [Pocillopora damicornis]|uniref:VWFA domain-containing protein n=1 Tax=Pocillopora damicornis TaxID=46731 RepID=A0A3M6V609_POCDA|nr:hypothetical protein pdam_00007555 [Pocillopora damicornis]